LKPYKILPGFQNQRLMSTGYIAFRILLGTYNEKYAYKFYVKTEYSKFIHITIFNYLFSSLAYILLVKSLIAVF
jgi:hypothetical protein